MMMWLLIMLDVRMLLILVMLGGGRGEAGVRVQSAMETGLDLCLYLGKFYLTYLGDNNLVYHTIIPAFRWGKMVHSTKI